MGRLEQLQVPHHAVHDGLEIVLRPFLRAARVQFRFNRGAFAGADAAPLDALDEGIDDDFVHGEIDGDGLAEVRPDAFTVGELVVLHILSSLRAGEPGDYGDGRRADDDENDVLRVHGERGASGFVGLLLHGISPWLYDFFRGG